MTHRALIAVSLTITVCFWGLSYVDRQLCVVHFYESLIYLAIATLLARFNDCWAYMLGMVGPGIWLLLILSSGCMEPRVLCRGTGRDGASGFTCVPAAAAQHGRHYPGNSYACTVGSYGPTVCEPMEKQTRRPGASARHASSLLN